MADYIPLSLPNGTTLTAEHLRHVEQGIVGADNERVITLNASSSAQDFQYAYTIYSTESAQVSYSDGDGELCSLIGVQDIGGEPTYYFLKPSKDRHIIVKTNTDTGAVTITKNSVGVIKIKLNADAGTLSAEDLATLSKNPERVVFERDGFYYFAENLSSTPTWYYSCNVYWGANGQIIKRVVEVTTSTGAYKKSDYPYTPANTTYSLSKSGNSIILTGSDGSSTSVPDSDTNTTYGAAGDALGLVKSGGDVTIADGVITVKDDSHNHSNYTSTSVLPNNSGEVKTKYRVAKKGYTGNTTSYHYYQLCKLQVNNDGNYASVIISGRIGGWTSTNMASINSLVWNRGTPGISVFAIAGDALAMSGGSRPHDSSVWDVCDLVLYKQSDNTAILYAKCTYWYVFDFNIEAYQSTTSIVYDGNPVTPAGELVASASTSEKRVEQVAGGLYVNGHLTPIMEDLDGVAYAADFHKVATSGSYNDLDDKPTIPTVNNAALTIQKNGSNVATFTANSSSNATANITVPTKTSELTNDSNYATTTQLATKLDKTTYEESKELALGSNGKVCLGKFGAYDTNITIEINSTTHTTYHATIVISTQNVVANGTGGTVGCYVYDDADNHITPLVSVFRPYGSASRQIEVYADLPGWSKNLVHVQGVAISDGGMTDVLTSVETIPTEIDGKIKVTPVNVLTTNFASKTEVENNLTAAKNYADEKAASIVGSAPETLNALNELASALGNDPNFATTVSNQIGQKASQADLDNLSGDVELLETEVGKKANTSSLHKVATSGSYNDLTNKPTIPAAVTVDSALSSTSTNPVQNKVVNSALAGKMSIDTNNGSYTNTKTYISHHPENGNGNIIPFIYNDIAHLLSRGGACSIYTTSATSYTSVDLGKVKTLSAQTALFDGSPSYQGDFSSILTGSETLIIDVTCHKTFYWSSTIYIDFGVINWTPSNVKILTSVAGGTYTERMSVTGLGTPALYKLFDGSSAGFSRIRFVLEKAKANMRVAQIGVINYGSSGATETLVSRGGSSMFGSLIPYNNYGANLGGSSNQWNAIYGSAIYENGTALSSKYASKTELGNKADADKVVTLNDTQTIPSNKTHTGYNTFLNNLFAIRANNVNDDSWINLTNSSNGAYYAFGIRRPYGNYGLQMKYHPDASNQDTSRPGDANGTGDIYYDIYHQGNYTRMPTATTSAPGLMSASDKASLDNIASNYVTKTQFEEVLGASLAEIDTLLGG